MASMLCEQGDMGLWNTPINEQDQQKLQESNTTTTAATTATEETKANK